MKTLPLNDIEFSSEILPTSFIFVSDGALQLGHCTLKESTSSLPTTSDLSSSFGSSHSYNRNITERSAMTSTEDIDRIGEEKSKIYRDGFLLCAVINSETECSILLSRTSIGRDYKLWVICNKAFNTTIARWIIQNLKKSKPLACQRTSPKCVSIRPIQLRDTKSS